MATKKSGGKSPGGKATTGKSAGAKKTAAKKTTPRKATAKNAKGAPLAPASGPVTLEQARALAAAKQPVLAAKAIAKDAQPPANPALVGRERRSLDKERRAEFERRKREYKAVMAVMKRRGARAPAPVAPKGKGASKGVVAKGGGGPAFAPLQVLAEGDSWFDYPIPFFGGGIIPRLEDRLGVPILNLAKAGDEVRFMLGVEERALMAEHLASGSPAGGHWDLLLFSGGGNDIVANPMTLWLRDWQAGVPPAQLLDPTRFAAALELVRAGYEDLIALRDKLSPSTHIVLQAYDFALPDGRGVCTFGPWLKPALDQRGFPTQADGAAVVKVMLQQFAQMLQSLTRANVTFVNNQGLLPPVKDSWHNELHPSRDGFEQHAAKFHAHIKQLFPTRVA